MHATSCSEKAHDTRSRVRFPPPLPKRIADHVVLLDPVRGPAGLFVRHCARRDVPCPRLAGTGDSCAAQRTNHLCRRVEGRGHHDARNGARKGQQAHALDPTARHGRQFFSAMEEGSAPSTECHEPFQSSLLRAIHMTPTDAHPLAGAQRSSGPSPGVPRKPCLTAAPPLESSTHRPPSRERVPTGPEQQWMCQIRQSGKDCLK